jgi:hypothetical protein
LNDHAGGIAFRDYDKTAEQAKRDGYNAIAHHIL